MAQLIQSMVGHRLQIQTLRQVIATQKIPQALIFSGPESIGKKKLAMALAQILICEQNQKKINRGALSGQNLQESDSACGVCGPCLRVEKKQSEDLKIIEPAGANIKVEQVRDILDYLSLSNFGKNRVIIFDQAHLMNAAAANSLLKTLEEPHQNVFFILIGPEVSNFMTTIRSRSQVIRFSALTAAELKTIQPNLPEWAYSCARGHVDKLLQLTSEEGQKNREESLLMLEHFWSDSEFLISDDWKKSVKDREQARAIIQIWSGFIRDLLILKTTAQKYVMNLDQSVRLKKLFQISTEKISDFSQALLQADRDLLGNGDSVLIFESLWVRYAR